MTATAMRPADLVAECLSGGVRRLLGGVHSLTSSRAVVVRADAQWVWVKFSTDPGRLPAPWEHDDDQPGWMRAPLGTEPGLRDASADPLLVVVGVGESQVLAVNALAIDEIGVTCGGREALIAHWLLQAQVQGAAGGNASILAGVRLSANPDATIVVADPLVDAEAGWVDVLAAGTSWPVRPLRQHHVSEGSESVEAQVVPGIEDDGFDEVTARFTDDDRVDPDAEAAPIDGDSSGDAASPALLKVFGRFEVTDATGAALQPMQQQIVAAIAFSQPIATAELCQMLYGSTRQKSFHVAMSKIRRRGLHPQLTEAGYRIDIASQWSQFVDLVGEDPAGADTQALARAAAMVSAPLFGEQPPPWAQPHLLAMRDLICRVCRELAARHAEDPAQALRYARLGLEVDSSHDELGQIAQMLTNRAWNDAVPDEGGGPS